MRVVRTVSEARAERGRYAGFGLVPTMGFLHQGHLSLVRAARAECGAVGASIFVNPAQFAPGGDFDRYPRALERDLVLLEAEGVDLVFAPATAEIYPAGFDALVRVGGVSQGLEGDARPGHFDGVATVVAKLFNIIGPSRAYFGQKDAQQLAVIRKLARDLDFPVEIRGMPTVREADGLAMSSRNSYLSAEERRAASVVPRALAAALEAARSGLRSKAGLTGAVHAELSRQAGVRPLYVSLSHPETLADVEEVAAAGALLSLAVEVGPARLIDNVLIGPFGAAHPDQPSRLSAA